MEIRDLDLRSRPLYLSIGAVIAVVLFLATRSFFSTPQIGATEEVFTTVDALFTAVTSRDKKRLEDCEQRLLTYRKAGNLPAAAASQLTKIIQMAQSGQWEPSARKLYDFMLAQRRNG